VQHFGTMMKYWLINFIWICFAITSCTPENSVPYYHAANFTPLWEGERNFSKDTLHTIAPFQFTNQDGKAITNANFKNKIYVASFFFTICPGICPKLTANLSKVADAFKDNPEVMFISHSVTPDIDSVSQLKQYAIEHGIRSGQWHLITGDKEEIYSLARQSYFAEREIGFQNSTQGFLHTEHFILVDQDGHIRGIYNGTLELEGERLVEDIKLLVH
jgi:protein SCO1